MNMKIVKPGSVPEKQTHTTVDTLELTHKLVNSWKAPPFQRDLKINAKVIAVSEEILRAGGVLPGILTIGIFDGDTYVVDGQHRIAAWQQTSLTTGYADVRMHFFESLADMANEFVKLNSQLVKLRPDDILRGYEASNVTLQRIRRKCGFVGYDMVRRSDKAPVLSMSVLLRMWAGSKTEFPAPVNSMDALKSMDEEETNNAIDFVQLCYDAWKRDVEYARLWSAVNLILCAWLYRRTVLGQHMSPSSRVTRMKKEEFRQGLLALSAESQYLDYLIGRNTGERDRAPAYNRIKAIFQRRFYAETSKKIQLPQPAWSHGTTMQRR
jgi:hypothetical protein